MIFFSIQPNTGAVAVAAAAAVAEAVAAAKKTSEGAKLLRTIPPAPPDR